MLTIMLFVFVVFVLINMQSCCLRPPATKLIKTGCLQHPWLCGGPCVLNSLPEHAYLLIMQHSAQTVCGFLEAVRLSLALCLFFVVFVFINMQSCCLRPPATKLMKTGCLQHLWLCGGPCVLKSLPEHAHLLTMQHSAQTVCGFLEAVRFS